MNDRYQELKNTLGELAKELQQLEAYINQINEEGISDPGYYDELCREHARIYNEEMVPIMDELESLKGTDQ